MARWTKVAVTLAAFLFPLVICTATTLAEPATPQPKEVTVNVICPPADTGTVSFTVHPWLYEVKSGEPGIWNLNISDPLNNEIEISAKGKDQSNWGYSIGSKKDHNKVVIDYAKVDQTGVPFDYNITITCGTANFEVVIDPMMIVE